MKSNDNEEKLFRGDEDLSNTHEPKNSNTIKDPDDWTTGDEPEFDENMTKAEASKKMEALQQQTGRGLDQA